MSDCKIDFDIENVRASVRVVVAVHKCPWGIFFVMAVYTQHFMSGSMEEEGGQRCG